MILKVLACLFIFFEIAIVNAFLLLLLPKKLCEKISNFVNHSNSCLQKELILEYTLDHTIQFYTGSSPVLHTPLSSTRSEVSRSSILHCLQEKQNNKYVKIQKMVKLVLFSLVFFFEFQSLLPYKHRKNNNKCKNMYDRPCYFIFKCHVLVQEMSCVCQNSFKSYNWVLRTITLLNCFFSIYFYTMT